MVHQYIEDRISRLEAAFDGLRKIMVDYFAMEEAETAHDLAKIAAKKKAARLMSGKRKPKPVKRR
jgi:hypothetical protein